MSAFYKLHSLKFFYQITMNIRWCIKLFALFFAPVINRKCVNILMYHSVGSGVNIELDIETSVFERHLTWLLKHGEIIPLSQYLNNLAHGISVENKFVLTFDDGFDNFYTQVLPLLEKYEAPACIFPALSFINDPQKVPIIQKLGNWNEFQPLTIQQLQSLVKSDLIEIGSHSYHHASFDHLTASEIIEDITRVDDWFLEKLNIKPSMFCYPRGNYSVQSEEILRERFSVRLGIDCSDQYTNVGLLQRTPVLRSDSMFWFKFRMKGYLYLDQIMLKTIRSFILQ